MNLIIQSRKVILLLLHADVYLHLLDNHKMYERAPNISITNKVSCGASLQTAAKLQTTLRFQH